jgi:hypothetical protein
VITKRRCPHTGVVNFYERAEPLLAIGSVTAAAEPAHFVWRSYSDDQESGIAPNVAIAEAHLRDAIARAKHAHA